MPSPNDDSYELSLWETLVHWGIFNNLIGWAVKHPAVPDITWQRWGFPDFLPAGLVAHSDLDERAIEALKEFNEEGALQVLVQFKESDLSHVQVSALTLLFERFGWNMERFY